MSDFRQSTSDRNSGADASRWSHQNPLKDLSLLIPCAVDSKFKSTVTPLPNPKTSSSLLDNLRQLGCQFATVQAPIYGSSGMGKPRLLDNSDMINGHEQLYDDVAHFSHVHKKAAALSGELQDFMADKEKTQPSSLVPSMEMQDLTKWTQQRGKYWGWWLQNPIAPSIRRTSYEVEEVALMGVLAREWFRLASLDHKVPQTGSAWLSLISLDSDPPDTMVGMPALASGENTHAARLATLQCLLSPAQPGVTPSAWLDHYSTLGLRMGLQENMAFAGVQSTRYGPTRKPIDLWFQAGAEVMATHQTEGYLPRVRLVYPAPYPVNFLLSPLYVMFSSARKRKLGLWHDPASTTKYIEALRKQGKRAYTIDFSGMDTSMPPHLIKMIASQFMAAGFPAWPCQLLNELMDRTGVISPSYHGNPTEVTYITKMFPWMSGFKLTSEVDTIYGMWTLLTALAPQIPGVVTKWLNGSFVICELGDDICFTTDVELDMEALASVALKKCGATLKVLDDALFLKRMLPIHPSVPELTKPLSRIAQQTLFNESVYIVPGVGPHPDAQMRLGLCARMETVASHPYIKELWPKMFDVIKDVGYLQRSDAAFMASLKAARPTLSKQDMVDILAFTQKAPSYMSELLNRAKFEPSAAAFLRTMEQYGLPVGSLQSPENSLVRKMYMDALLSPPTPRAFETLLALSRWSPNQLGR